MVNLLKNYRLSIGHCWSLDLHALVPFLSWALDKVASTGYVSDFFTRNLNGSRNSLCSITICISRLWMDELQGLRFSYYCLRSATPRVCGLLVLADIFVSQYGSYSQGGCWQIVIHGLCEAFIVPGLKPSLSRFIRMVTISSLGLIRSVLFGMYHHLSKEALVIAFTPILVNLFLDFSCKVLGKVGRNP